MSYLLEYALEITLNQRTYNVAYHLDGQASQLCHTAALYM